MNHFSFVSKFGFVISLFLLSVILEHISKEIYSSTFVGLGAICLGIYFLYQLDRSFRNLKKTVSLAKENETLTIERPSNEVDQFIIKFNNLVHSRLEMLTHYKYISSQLMQNAEKTVITAKEQEASINQHEESTNEILHASNEILFSSKELVELMNGVDDIAQEASDLTKTGQSSLHRMSDLMHVLADTSKHIATILTQLNEKTEGIRFVIVTMTKVADQTNLLSLNAALEAEKAKDSGKGFSVIAKEIRRLADQTAHATLDIEKLVNDMIGTVFSSVSNMDAFIEDIQSGVKESTKVGDLMSEILVKVQTFVHKLAEVNHRIQQQSHNADRINEAIHRLSVAAQNASVTIHDLNTRIGILNRTAQELQSS